MLTEQQQQHILDLCRAGDLSEREIASTVSVSRAAVQAVRRRGSVTWSIQRRSPFCTLCEPWTCQCGARLRVTACLACYLRGLPFTRPKPKK
jgi:hypothetical protein